MMTAAVGDDLYGDDPSVRALEAQTAEVLGKEDAVYVVTGTMANQSAVAAHTRPGDLVAMEAGGHVFVSEAGAPAVLSGVSVLQIPGERGMLTAQQVRSIVPVEHAFLPEHLESRMRLLCLENTHNVAGGTVWPLAALAEAAEVANQHGMRTHLDGARLWNASAESGIAPAAYAAPFDSVSVCFSKGLGAPMGSAVAGSRDFVKEVRRFKQLFGGGFRQAGLMAAGASHALEHHRARLVDDHANAATFADLVAQTPGLRIDRDAVQTNIVRFSVETMSAETFVDRCFAEGVHMLPGAHNGVRAVFYLDITAADTVKAHEAIVRALG